MKKALFGVTEIEGSANAANIQSSLSEYIDFVGLGAAKMAGIVRDDAGNVKNAAKLMKKDS